MAKVKAIFSAQTNRVYFHRVEQALLEAIAVALDRTLKFGEQVAKKHAPVRKVTKTGRGHGARTRELDAAEIADLPDFVRRSIDASGRSYTTGRRLRTTVKRSAAGFERPIIKAPSGKRSRTVPTIREVTEGSKVRGEIYTLRHPGLRSYLNAEGRRALRTGVGVDVVRGKVLDEGGRLRSYSRATLGGRLKREIIAVIDNSGVQSGIFKGELLSPTEYARYVEFPTSRTAAQPYMRPARDAMAERLPKEIEAQLIRVGQSGGVT